jgi:ankyrin repeat protein
MAKANPSSHSLPARPNLSYLKKLAKEKLKLLRATAPATKLAGAQLAVARQFGFASWRQLKAHVDATKSIMPPTVSPTMSVPDDADFAAKVAEFLLAAVSHHTDEPPATLKRAEAILAENPRIATTNLLTACVLGDAKTASEFLARDSDSATTTAGPKAWPPILYLCFSRYLRHGPRRESAFVRIAKMLIRRGADPNSLFIHEGFNETALYGAAGISNRPRLTKLLLDAGADPGDRSDKSGSESLYHACEHADNKCLSLLLRAKPRGDAISYCLNRKLDFEDPAGAKLMLDHGADPNYCGVQGGTALLHAIRRGRSVAIIKLLHKYGATLDISDPSGMTPLKLARRLGQKETAKFLLRQGAIDAPDATEQFLTACAAGSLREAKKLLKDDVNLIRRLGPDEVHVLPDAAASNRDKPVRLMLDLGFDIDAKGDWGGSAVHQAAWNGHNTLLKLLIHRGADLQQKNGFGGDLLHTAIHGAAHGRHKNGAEIVAIVLEAMKPTDLGPYIKHATENGDQRVLDVLGKRPDPETKARELVRRMQRASTESLAIIEKRFDDDGGEPRWEATALYSPTLREAQADELIVGIGDEALYRMIAIWHATQRGAAPPTRTIERLRGDPLTASPPSGGKWRRIVWRPTRTTWSFRPGPWDDLAEAMRFVQAQHDPDQYRIVTVRRMLRAVRDRGRLKVVKKHAAENPDAWPTLRASAGAAPDSI